jgi:hypothetical protein
MAFQPLPKNALSSINSTRDTVKGKHPKEYFGGSPKGGLLKHYFG